MPDGAQPCDAVIAVWPDGDEHAIADLTVAQYQGTVMAPGFSGETKKRRLREKQAMNAFFTVRHEKDGDEIRVQVDKDRGWLVRVHRAGRAVCQVSQRQIKEMICSSTHLHQLGQHFHLMFRQNSSSCGANENHQMCKHVCAPILGARSPPSLVYI